MILSAGSFGCNMHCPLCRNAEISQSGGDIETTYVSPESLAEKALSLVSWEYVRDASRCVRSFGMKNVVVTNGCAGVNVIEKVLPYIDAMNIDLKGFTRERYEILGGDSDVVKDTIAYCAKKTHVEVTTLIVPGKKRRRRGAAQWILKIDKKMPLYITRFFPRRLMKDAEATPLDTVYRSVSIAREYLDCVYPGNCRARPNFC